jgi:hypothetical protein
MAASEIYDMAFGGQTVPEDVEDDIRPILVALKLLADGE